MTDRKMKIQIKSITGDVLFELTNEGNTIKKTVEEAVRRKINLRNSNLRNSDLSYSNLRNSDLRGSDLSYSDLRNSDLRGSDLSYSNLEGSYLGGSDLSYSDLRSSNLRGSNLRNSDLSYSNLEGSKNLPNIYKTPLYLLKHQPVNTKLRAYKYLRGNKSPYQNFEYEIGKTYTVEKSNEPD